MVLNPRPKAAINRYVPAAVGSAYLCFQFIDKANEIGSTTRPLYPETAAVQSVQTPKARGQKLLVMLRPPAFNMSKYFVLEPGLAFFIHSIKRVHQPFAKAP